MKTTLTSHHRSPLRLFHGLWLAGFAASILAGTMIENGDCRKAAAVSDFDHALRSGQSLREVHELIP